MSELAIKEANLPKPADDLCWHFHTASGEDTLRLGQLFAGVVHDFMAQAQSSRLRIGIEGHLRYGKTTFAKGIYGTIEDKAILEENNKCRPQFTWYCTGGTSLRAYDAVITWQEAVLPSYANDNDQLLCPKHVDIVEHWKCDKNNKEFDCTIKFNFVTFYKRDITIRPTAALAATNGFKMFLKEAASFMAEKPPSTAEPAL